MSEAETYTCPVCGRTSHHPMDAKHGYCSACQGYTREEPPSGMRWVLFHGGPLDRCGRLLPEPIEVGMTYERAIDGDARYVYDGEAFFLEKIVLMRALLMRDPRLRASSEKVVQELLAELAEYDEDDPAQPLLTALAGGEDVPGGDMTVGELRGRLRVTLEDVAAHEADE